MANFNTRVNNVIYYENLTPEAYASLEKNENAFYQVNGLGLYKGSTLIAAVGNDNIDGIIEITRVYDVTRYKANRVMSGNVAQTFFGQMSNITCTSGQLVALNTLDSAPYGIPTFNNLLITDAE
jgi:hypothetical protein